MKLIIGNKTYSSWSLRPWFLMKHVGIPFEEILIKLDLPETTKQIKQYSPTGKVPALIHEKHAIWESVAILEYLHELFPEKNLYPKDQYKRALARSLVMEMHAGFSQMRDDLSFNIKKNVQIDLTKAQSDIDRMQMMWTEQLEKSGGPFLLGEFSIVDAMYAPIPFRFQMYNIEVSGPVKEYCEMMLNLPAMKEWHAGAMAEDFIAPFHS